MQSMQGRPSPFEPCLQQGSDSCSAAAQPPPVLDPSAPPAGSPTGAAVRYAEMVRMDRRRLGSIAAHVASGGGAGALVATAELATGDTIEIRPAKSRADAETLARIPAYVFASQVPESAFGAKLAQRLDALGPEPYAGGKLGHVLAAFDGAQGVSQVLSLPWSMLGPGGAPVPINCISAVGTLPEYRRRGLLRKMMTRTFAESRARGECVAALWASMAAIYQRYGFAETTRQRCYTVDSVDVQFVDGDTGSCSVARCSSMAEALPRMEAVYTEYASQRQCCLSWAARRELWRRRSGGGAAGGEDEDNERGPPVGHGFGPAGAAPKFVALATDPSTGACTGYVTYVTNWNHDESVTAHPTRSQALTVGELVFTDTNAYRSLWSFLGRHDLVGEIVWHSAAPDDPAAELFQVRLIVSSLPL